jgi:hypothetical protein
MNERSETDTHDGTTDDGRQTRARADEAIDGW